MNTRDFLKVAIVVAVVVFVYPLLKKLFDGLVGKQMSGVATFLAVLAAVLVLSQLEAMV